MGSRAAVGPSGEQEASRPGHGSQGVTPKRLTTVARRGGTAGCRNLRAGAANGAPPVRRYRGAWGGPIILPPGTPLTSPPIIHGRADPDGQAGFPLQAPRVRLPVLRDLRGSGLGVGLRPA